jgi:hypothetical protein
VCGQHHAPAAFTPGKDPVPIVQEPGWAPELFCRGAENLATPGFVPRNFQPVASPCIDYAIPALEVSKKLRFPDFITTAQDGGKLVSLMHRVPLPPGNTPGTRFCYRLNRPQGHNATCRIMSRKNSNDTIGNRTHDLPVCSAAP